MRKINLFVIHCIATKEGLDIDVSVIRSWHKNKGYRDIGYHYVIKLDGTIEKGRSEESIGAHVQGFNANSIGICYVGGLDKEGNPADTRTDAQKKSLKRLYSELKAKYPNAKWRGHRDLSPDIDGDGTVEKCEWMKACPSFEVKEEFK
jgi:N-acetyl-anhydromuramyl-L-alanine amidase AmpD